MCSVMERMVCPQRVASDIHPDLILMWQALQKGWRPPDTVSLEEYRMLKKSSPSALRNFAGFGCSFAGKWFGGYARDGRGGGRNYAARACRSLLRKIQNLQDVEFYHKSYMDFDQKLLRHPALVYCDPPYRASTADYASGLFDAEAFWQWVREQSCTVLVSEYEAPEDFEKVWSCKTKTDLRGTHGKGCIRQECLFRRRG